MERTRDAAGQGVEAGKGIREGKKIRGVKEAGYVDVQGG